MDRMIQKNVIAMSGRAVEAAGDVDVLLLDKTGTITLGNRQATAFYPADGVGDEALADAAQLASLADETPEGRSIVVLAKEQYRLREREVEKLGATFVPFTAQTRMSGVDLNGRQIRKGAADAIDAHVIKLGGGLSPAVRTVVDRIAKEGATPARRRGWSGGARGDPAQGHRQGRHQGALRGDPEDGNPDHHDHR
jgi:K+-transporting ATPase ATPase B chain